MHSVTIKPVSSLSAQHLDQVKTYAPQIWQWFRSQLWTFTMEDVWVKAASQWYACLIMNDDTQLVSFGILTKDSVFHKAMADSLEKDPETCATIMYVFTRLEFQKQWYAKMIFDNLASFANVRLPPTQELIRSTGSEKNKQTYLHYWATLQTPKQRSNLLINEWIDTDFFFSKKIPFTF